MGRYSQRGSKGLMGAALREHIRARDAELDPEGAAKRVKAEEEHEVSRQMLRALRRGGLALR